MKKFISQFIMLFLGVLFLVLSFSFSTRGFKGDVLNQRDYVIILAGLLIIAALSSIVVGFFNKKKPGVEKKSQQKISRQNMRKIYFSMLLTLLFAYGFSYIGFFVTSFVFVFLITWMYSDWNKKEWLKYLIFSTVLNTILYFVFDLIKVYFPDTLLF